MEVAGRVRGYHKPVMLAGGLGNIRAGHINQQAIDPGARLIVLGGPAMLIGLGGGAASSMATGTSDAELDFASVQRGNPEIQHRCQEVIDQCWQLGEQNPVQFIHDVGAGGLSNALPELIKDGGVSGLFDLRAIPSAEPGMSPLEIWCNEAQERFVLAVHERDMPRFVAICERERCPFAIVGEAIGSESRLGEAMVSVAGKGEVSASEARVSEARQGEPIIDVTAEGRFHHESIDTNGSPGRAPGIDETADDTSAQTHSRSQADAAEADPASKMKPASTFPGAAGDQLCVQDALSNQPPVNLPLSLLFGKPPKMHKQVSSQPNKTGKFTPADDLDQAIQRVLAHPTVASKSFLITIGDRSVGGLVCRDQMVGPWQVPVADVAVTASSFVGYTGEAMALGERTPLALLSSPAAARMAVAEAITNILAADIASLGDIRLSANWMAASGEPGEDANLHAAVQAVGMELCPALGIVIPVGKDSMSMATRWQEVMSAATGMENGTAAASKGDLSQGGARPELDQGAASASKETLPMGDARQASEYHIASANRNAMPHAEAGSGSHQAAASNVIETAAHAIEKSVSSPLSLIVSAFAPVADIRLTLTPQLATEDNPELIFIDLAEGRQRLGASILAQCHAELGDDPPDLVSPDILKGFSAFMAEHRQDILAYHDRSDGGLFACLCEMAFASRTGLDILLPADASPLPFLFNEELGVVIQVREDAASKVMQTLASKKLPASIIARINKWDEVRISRGIQVAGKITDSFTDSLAMTFKSVFTGAFSGVGSALASRFLPRRLLTSISRADLQAIWSRVSFEIQQQRDNPESAQEEFASIQNAGDPGLSMHLSFDPAEDITRPLNIDAGFDSAEDIIASPNIDTSIDPTEARAAPFVNTAKPRVAILREQGVNSQVEMAAAFHRAGFAAIDLHATELTAGQSADMLAGFQGLAICGGFSFGDVLGAGGGWAKSILANLRLRDAFAAFLARETTFTLGVCNGCQMLAALKELVPGAEHWPAFIRNRSEQFEARLAMVRVEASNSIFLEGMAGSSLPIVVSHAEGRADIDAAGLKHLAAAAQTPLRYVDNHLNITQAYPANPNGSPAGLAGVSSGDGRVLAMMPHPDRCFRTEQLSWHPTIHSTTRHEDSPWMRLFRNARVWVG